uniref:Uncharacterized protein n=1 Tax=Desulfovibrio sp. U5L TaxID=596152 RepID=I2PYD9_9BACT
MGKRVEGWSWSVVRRCGRDWPADTGCKASQHGRPIPATQARRPEEPGEFRGILRSRFLRKSPEHLSTLQELQGYDTFARHMEVLQRTTRRFAAGALLAECGPRAGWLCSQCRGPHSANNSRSTATRRCLPSSRTALPGRLSGRLHRFSRPSTPFGRVREGVTPSRPPEASCRLLLSHRSLSLPLHTPCDRHPS